MRTFAGKNIFALNLSRKIFQEGNFMLKKIFVGALIALSSFGIFSISEAHHYNYDGGCYNGGYCCR